VVSPRPTSFISGLTSWLTETWVKPTSRAIAATRASWSVKRKPCSSTTATARKPASNASCSPARAAASSSGRNTAPSTLMRSSISTTRV
jgi:hypothetical protein